MKRKLELVLTSKQVLQGLLLFILGAAPGVATPTWCGNPSPPCSEDSPGSPCYKPKPPDPRCEPVSCGKCTKSPCYVGTGVYADVTTDLQIPTNGFPLTVARKYESSHAIDGPAGYGWTLSLSARLYYTTYLFAAPSTYQKEADITMPDGARYRFVDNGNGTFTPPLGRYDTLILNTDGTFDLTLQRTSSIYHFAADGSLLSMTDDYGNALVMTYDANGRIQRVADNSGSGRYIDVYWGADGRISGVQDSAGRQMQYTYDIRGVLTSATDPMNRMTSYGYTPGKYVPLLAWVRDPWNRLVTEVTYDASDRTRTYTEGGETYTYTYNYQNSGKTAKSDSSGNAWVYVYGSGGLVSESRPPTGTGIAYADYYPDGLVKESWDEIGVRTYYTYDSQGRVLTEIRDHLGSSAVQINYAYDPGFPYKVTSVTPVNPATNQVDPNWQAWRYDYYQAGSPAPGALHHIYRVHADGVAFDTIITYEYDVKGRLLREVDASGADIRYQYDTQGNAAVISAPPNNAFGIRRPVTYGYDALGRVTSILDAAGGQTLYGYDAIDRVSFVTIPKPATGSSLDFTTHFDYDDFDASNGLVFKTITDANGRQSRLGYDQYENLVRDVDSDGHVTLYGFNKGLLRSLTDATGNSFLYYYDSLRRLSKTVFPDLAQEISEYYADGLLKKRTDRKGQAIIYSYDRLKRLISKVYPDLTTVVYSYAGQKLTSVADSRASGAETHTFTYDQSFRIASNSQSTRGTLQFSYALNDHLASYSVANGGPTATYSYYPDGSSVQSIQWTPVAGSFEYTYNLRGQYEGIVFPNGQRRDYKYDLQGRLLQIANTHSSAGDLGTFVYSYDYDHATSGYSMLGQVTGLMATYPGQSSALTKYYYDGRYRLARVDYPGAAPFNGEVGNWTYDPVGNRVSSTLNGIVQQYSYFRNGTNADNGQRLQSDGTRTFSYDANGSEVAVSAPPGGLSFAWDYDNQLIGISGAASASYKYDYDGRRVLKSAGGSTSSYLYVGLSPVADVGPQQIISLGPASMSRWRWRRMGKWVSMAWTA